MKHVIWVVGASSSGKQTFLNNILINEKLQDQVGIGTLKIALEERSVKYPGDATILETVRERELIPYDVAILLQTEVEVVLIKWQYIDSLYNLPAKLEGGLYNAQHSVIVLEANEIDSLERLELKDWWRAKGFETAKELYDHEHVLINKHVTELSKSYEIVKLDSSNHADYRLLI